MLFFLFSTESDFKTINLSAFISVLGKREAAVSQGKRKGEMHFDSECV